MIYNVITKVEDIEKVVTDILFYIEKETDILIDHSTLEGIFAWITYDSTNLTSPTICMPAEFYWVNSKNYSIRFKMHYCICECCQKIIDIELEPTNSFYEEDLEDVTMILEDIIPDISISPYIPNFGYVEYE